MCSPCSVKLEGEDNEVQSVTDVEHNDERLYDDGDLYIHIDNVIFKVRPQIYPSPYSLKLPNNEVHCQRLQ